MPESCAYRISKYALRELTSILEIENSSGVVKIAGLDPGWTKTRMGGLGAEREIEDTVDQVMQEIDNLLGRSYG
jgi:NAD(P)-dependent dehydrogenase (short-subunit alcohol dehydrogenase family)